MGSSTVTAWLIVSWFLGLCALVNVVRQPKVVFAAAGHSKRFWFWFVLVGTVLSYTGIIVWAVYRIGISPSLVKAGGRRPFWFRFLAAQGGSSGGAPTASTSGPGSSGSSDWHSKPAACSACNGRGKNDCGACQGRGRVTNAAYASAAVGSDDWCSRCSGSGSITCSSCSGRGTR